MIERYTYDIYGGPSVSDANGNDIGSSAVANRFLFTGREYLAELGLYDYRNRVYSPGLGRFLQTDPIRFDAGDVNLYRYVFNGAVNRDDATGQGNLMEWILELLHIGHGGHCAEIIAKNQKDCVSKVPKCKDTNGMSNYAAGDAMSEYTECLQEADKQTRACLQKLNDELAKANCATVSLPGSL